MMPPMCALAKSVKLIRLLALFVVGIFPTASISHSPFPHFPLENSVLAEPRVDCGVETITVWIRTEKLFRGRLYVEDESEHPDCVHSYTNSASGGPTDGPGAAAADSRGAEFSIRFGECNMRRQRLLNPRGVTYSFTLIISFHPIFLTGIDRAFNIKCFFIEAVKALDATLDVSPLVTSVVEREFTLPQCNYHLKHGVDGPFVKYASIGEPITHVWQCDPVAGWLYGLLIHSCFVDDGHGNRFDLVDDRGCVTDHSLLAEIDYDEKSFAAYAHTHVFRYADKVQLFFTCTVQLCFREDGGCEGISPPKCLDHGRRMPSAKFDGPLHIPQPPPFARPPPGLDRSFRPTNLPFGHPPPFKDSPLMQNANETTADQLLSDIFLLTNRSRAGRNAAELGRHMETDLSADLTVVPRTTTTARTKEDLIQNTGTAAEKNPFVRVLPIKSDEYGGGPMSITASLDSQRFSSLEVLSIAIASFVATFTVTSMITIFCLQRCRLRNMPFRKMMGIENMDGMIIS